MNQIDCSKVYVDTSTFCTPDNSFSGAFANINLSKGELVEKGFMRRLHDSFNGMENPYVFTWSDDIPNHTWAFASGCATFYNSSLEKDANTRMVRHFSEDRFEIFATRDIHKGEELTHMYKSLRWRTVFKDLNELLENTL
jgi:hypothetical protein